MTDRTSLRSFPELATEEPRPTGELRLLPPAFVELSADQAERAESALAELLAAAAQRAAGTAP